MAKTSWNRLKWWKSRVQYMQAVARCTKQLSLYRDCICLKCVLVLAEPANMDYLLATVDEIYENFDILDEEKYECK
jgi:hypothetical protein